MDDINQLLEINPIIAALPHMMSPEQFGNPKSEVVFLLSGSVMEIQERVGILKDLDKKVFIHVDLIDGLARDAAAMEYIQKYIQPHGVLSTRSNLLRLGKEMGLLTVQRIFMIDSLSFESGIKMVRNYRPDFVEVMPGIIPRAISELGKEISQPIIAGGMITNKADVIQALKAGALAVSTSKQGLWNLD